MFLPLLYSCVTQFELNYELLTVFHSVGKLNGLDIFVHMLRSVCLIILITLAGVTDAILIEVRFTILMSLRLVCALICTY